jgi:formylglycine-generating enzyme required for sulfatase activity
MTQNLTTSRDQSSSVIVWPDDGKDMVLIEEATFVMGSNDGNPNHKPEHQVHVDSFYLDVWPVTNAEYKRFIDETNRAVPDYRVDWVDTEGYTWNTDTRMYPAGKANHPVVLVTWEDAMAYAAWANKRLPTEAEWERAARGVDGRRYPWGNDFSPEIHCNCKETGLNGTSAVAEFSPEGDTPEGLVDMVGNVWEWTNSLYRPYPYNAEDGRESRDAAGFRVLRGASWVNDANVAYCMSRLDGDFQFFTNVGFRCAVSPE